MELKYQDRGCQDAGGLSYRRTSRQGGLSYRETDVWKLSVFVLNLHIFP